MEAWVLGVAAMLRRATDLDENEPWPESPGALEMETVYGVAGQLRPGERRAANDQLAALLILLFIWWWNCAKYRALLRVSTQNQAYFFQIEEAPVLSSNFAETRTIWRFPNRGPFFPGSVEQCQMNTPLT